MQIPFINPQNPELPHQTIFSNPTIGTPQPDPSRMEYHAKVERFEEELLAVRARLAGKAIVETKDGLVFESVMDEHGHVIPPFCSIRGQHEIFNFMKEHLNSGTTLTNIDTDRFYILMKNDHIQLHALVHLNVFEWEVQTSYWSAIHFSFLGMIESAKRRAIDNEERSWITKFVNQLITTTTQPEKQNKSFLDGLFSQGKRS